MPRVRDDFLDVPFPARFSSHHRSFRLAMGLHAAAVSAGMPVYQDPATGNSVFTAAFLADRGDCCESGCRHCPFVPDEPDRS